MTRLGEVDGGGNRYSRKAMANGGNTMFYIHILNQPPHQGTNPSISKLIVELEQKSLVQHYQIEARKIHQRTREKRKLSLGVTFVHLEIVLISLQLKIFESYASTAN